MCTAYFFTGEYQIDVCLLEKLGWTYKGLKVIFIIQAVSRVLLRPKTGHFAQPVIVVTSRKPFFFPIGFNMYKKKYKNSVYEGIHVYKSSKDKFNAS